MTRGQTVRLKRRFLEAFRRTGNITQACGAVGLTRRQTVYEWQELDDQFAAGFREAEIMATEYLEQEALRRAVEGVTSETPIYNRGEYIDTIVETKYSDTLLIFLLKARNPNKYRERVQLQHADADGQKFPLSAIRQALGIGVGDGD